MQKRRRGRLRSRWMDGVEEMNFGVYSCMRHWRKMVFFFFLLDDVVVPVASMPGRSALNHVKLM